MRASFTELDNKHSVSSEEYHKSPCYISARSADVILSDIRPTNLSSDALNSVNALLDELLHSVTHNVGKEAVLEAEMELRAYWERTGAPGAGSSQVITDDASFDLKWVFELLRLNCETYSTLSDTDENAEAEGRLFERMNAEGITPPKQSLLAPASLYLTAIIESICEHILSNVGRVVARDSSRAMANSQDLFIALCEDSSIYGLFKNMKVYEQIEILSKLPKPRRSQSFSRDSIASPLAGPFVRDASLNGTRPRMSLESSSSSPAAVANSNMHPSRPSSIDKPRTIKKFDNRASQHLHNGSEPQIGHRKIDSFASANTKQSFLSKSDRSPISPTFSEDARSQEFDDMMRSGSTMKVSLTPDRLRTMEVLNKDKARTNGRSKVAANPEKSSGAETPSFFSSPEQAKRGKQTLRHVGSIIESEEDRFPQKPPPTSRPRQLSAATASGYSIPSLTRIRASSTSDPSTAILNMFPPKQAPRSESNPFPRTAGPAPASIQRRKAPPHELDINASRPPRTQTVARNLESLDLDDIMGGSDDEDEGLKPPAPIKQPDRQRGVSASARELIDFLAEGPPEPPANENSLSPTPKKSGRLQKMISRITLNGNESMKSPRKAVGYADAPSRSMTNLSPLANRPIPPRYPTSTPPSSTSSERGSGDQEVSSTRQRTQSFARKPIPKSGEPVPVPSVPSLLPGMETVPLRTSSPGTGSSKKSSDIDMGKHVQPVVKPLPSSAPLSPTSTRVESPIPAPAVVVQPSFTPLPVALPVLPERVSSKAASVVRPRAAQPVQQTPSLPPSIFEHVRDMRRMLAHATNADECRLLVDIFLTRTKLVADAVELKSLAAIPSPQDSGAREPTPHLEKTVVGLFLGDGEHDPHPPAPTSNPVDEAEQQSEPRSSSSSSSSVLPNGNAESVESH
ncbi:hypothetical protein BU15DRAFT_75030 [Melanogaster broomeanus]|nr:hypothetical protein BU15DRAFT_75030 [Melanogaster broomeanus]